MAELTEAMQAALDAGRGHGGLRYIKGGFWIPDDAPILYDGYPDQRLYRWPKPAWATGLPEKTVPYWSTGTIKALLARGLVVDARSDGARFIDRVRIPES